MGIAAACTDDNAGVYGSNSCLLPLEAWCDVMGCGSWSDEVEDGGLLLDCAPGSDVDHFTVGYWIDNEERYYFRSDELVAVRIDGVGREYCCEGQPASTMVYGTRRRPLSCLAPVIAEAPGDDAAEPRCDRAGCRVAVGLRGPGLVGFVAVLGLVLLRRRQC